MAHMTSVSAFVHATGRLLPHRLLLLRRRPPLLSHLQSLHGLPPPRHEYMDHAEYPALPNTTDRHEVEQQKLEKAMQSLRTVEEKLYYLNKPKYFGWYSTIIEANKVPYGSLEFVQYATWTHVVSGLPPEYASLDAEADRLAEKVLPRLERFLLGDREAQVEGTLRVGNDRAELHQSFAMPMSPDTKRVVRVEAQRLVESIHRILQMELAPSAPHLLRSQVDTEARVEAFWFRGGFDPDKSMVKKRLGTQKILKKDPHLRAQGEMQDHEIHQRHDRAFQVEGSSMVQLRSPLAIAPFVRPEHELCSQKEKIPRFHHDPRSVGYKSRCQVGTNTPGFWTCSNNGFTWLQMVSGINHSDKLTDASSRKSEFSEREDLLLTKAILGSFGQLLPMACNLGFSPMNDPDTPLVTQTAVTDGMRWKLSVYQLNRTALHREPDKEGEGRPNNICWHLPEFELVRTNEESGEKEINREGLRDIVKFYLTAPCADVDRVAKYVHEIKDTYNREYFHGTFRHMYAKRSRHLDKPEILAYQKLYMVDHDLMFPYGLRERPWFKMAKINFLGREHWHPEFKHYDHYSPPHKPKAFRERLNRRWDSKVKKVVPPLPEDE